MNSRNFIFLTLGLAGLGAAVPALAQQNPPPSPPSFPADENVAPAPADRIVHSVQLPSVQQLMDMARAQGTTVVNVDQTANAVTVTYRVSDNSTRTVSYQLLPTQGSPEYAPQTQFAATPPPAPVHVVEMVPPPPPTVIYRYYDRAYDPFYYDPFYWGRRAPISINLGFGSYRGGYDYPYRGGHYRHRPRHHRW